MRRVELVNFADDRFGHKGALFRRAQEKQCETALKNGVNRATPWTFEQLAQTEFYGVNKAYLDRPYHLCGFAFKPFIVQQALDRLRWGDVLIYYDSGDGQHVFDAHVAPIVEMCLANGGTLIHQWGDSNKKWTKRDCFYFMGLDHPDAHNGVAIQATWFVLEKNEFTMNFVHEYLHYTLDERVASYQNDRVCGLPDLPGFVENRGDQSVLSLLAYKYRLRTFRGVGGPDNRIIGNFIRWQTVAGRCQIVAKQQARKLAVKVGNLKHKLERLKP